MPGWQDDPVVGGPAAAPAAKPWDTDPVVQPEAPEIGAGTKALNMIGRGAWALPGLVGLDYETVNAAEMALRNPSNLQGGFGDRFSQYKQGLLRQSRRVDTENPITSGLVRGVAAAPGEALAWSAAPAAKLAQGASAATRALTYGPRIGTLAAASEYGSTANKDAGDRALGAGVAGVVGGALGAGMGAALPNPSVLAPKAHQVANPAQAVADAGVRAGAKAGAFSAADASADGGAAAARNVTTLEVKPRKPKLSERIVRQPDPVPEAQYLMERGVPLTGGLKDPSSAYALQEMSSQSLSGVGPRIRQQRGNALNAAMDQAFTEALPPGAKVQGWEGDINSKYATLKGLWDKAYDAIRSKDELIQPAVLEGDFGRPLVGNGETRGVIDDIIDDTTDPLAAVWDDISRGQAKKFLSNQFTRLNTGAKDEAGRVPLGDMMKVLSDVRKASRAALEGEKYDLHQILSRAEDAIEQAVESQASPQTRAELRALNAKYRDFKTVEDAVVRARDAPGGISPAQLSMSVKATEPMRSRYAAGGGGELRNLSKAVRTVFDESASPPTGARLLSVAPKWAREGFIGPAIYLRNESALGAQGGSAAAQAGAAAQSKAITSAQAEALARVMQQAEKGPGRQSAAALRLPSATPAASPLAALLEQLGLSLSPATAEEDGK